MKTTTFLSFLFSLMGTCLFAQSNIQQSVSINANGAAPDASALLDVKAIDKGILVPRMMQADRIAIASPAEGLLVYQTDGEEGFYFFNGANWTNLLSNGNGWSLSGNVGTASNFIGTTNNQSLVFKTNNLQSGVIDLPNNSTYFGYSAGMSQFNGLVNDNTGIGAYALLSNQTGDKNTAVGVNALHDNLFGHNNTAVGMDALFNIESSNNTALGQGAGHDNNGSGNLFLGKDAGYFEAGSDKLYIENSNSSKPLIGGDFSSNRVGINTISPSATLHVEGSVLFGSSSFAFYANDGGGSCDVIGCATSTADVSIFASNRVRASEFNAFSDARIKCIERRSDPAADLAILAGLKVTDYHYVDVVGKGADLKKGFIAQEVEQVFPEAVSKSKDFVPNIYRMASAVHFDAEKRILTVTLDSLSAIQTGDKVRLISNSTFEKEVVAATLGSFTVGDWTEQDTKQVFIFGKEVTDFRNVDYDRIFTLGVSAVQALAGKVEKLEAENATLRAGVEMLKAAVFGEQVPVNENSPWKAGR